MEQLFGAIPAVLSGLAANENIDEAVVFAGWQRCAGELLNERTVAVEYFENRLIVAVADQTWQRHMEDLGPQMLAKLNGSLGQGTVKFIEFRIDKKRVEARRDLTKKEIAGDARPIKVSPSLTAAANAILDDSLRHQFLSAASVYLAKQAEAAE